MKWKGIVISAVLQAQLPITDAAPVPGLTDPRLCYILDGILFIYAVIITALFLKAKFSKAPEAQALQGQNDVYNKLSRTTRDEYDVLGTKKRGSDLEMGGRNQRRKKPQDTVYTSLQKDKMGEAYSEIGKKGEVSGTFLFNKGRYNDAKNFPSHTRGSHYNTHPHDYHTQGEFPI
ncbi:T-cell surface glycoprotein CD3 zeta chain isoform 2-T2 [Macrochelys suwanniensis]